MVQSLMKRRRLPHLLFALIVVAVVVSFRVALNSEGMDLIEQFEQASGIEVGPDHSFFGAGLDGDGATVVIVALDPFGTDLGLRIFDSSYRYTRLAHPWLAMLVTAGSPNLILLGVSLVGLLAVGILAYIASANREQLGWRSWLLIANPALILGVLGDTTEPLSALLLTLSLMTGSAVFGAATAMSRPSYLVALWGRWRVLAVGVSVAALVRLIWSSRLETPFLEGGRNLDWPLVGIVDSPSVTGALVMLAGICTAVVGLARRDWGWVGGGLFVLLFAEPVVSGPTHMLRAAGYLPVLWGLGPNWVPRRSSRRTRASLNQNG